MSGRIVGVGMALDGMNKQAKRHTNIYDEHSLKASMHEVENDDVHAYRRTKVRYIYI